VASIVLPASTDDSSLSSVAADDAARGKDVNHAASPTILENARHHSTTYSHHDLRAAPLLQIHNVSKT